jgi:hypothetical protein
MEPSTSQEYVVLSLPISGRLASILETCSPCLDGLDAVLLKHVCMTLTMNHTHWDYVTFSILSAMPLFEAFVKFLSNKYGENEATINKKYSQ